MFLLCCPGKSFLNFTGRRGQGLQSSSLRIYPWYCHAIRGNYSDDRDASLARLNHVGPEHMHPVSLNIRSELEHDGVAIFRVNSRAFGRDAEAQLVDALRAGGYVGISLVAALDQLVVGHILFS